jgi:hypothetical protein
MVVLPLIYIRKMRIFVKLNLTKLLHFLESWMDMEVKLFLIEIGKEAAIYVSRHLEAELKK